MMGLTPKETRRRLDAVIEFAELEEFVDLKLKNYSSGMLVRLAFSVMLEADADVLLIDEVLAVGDAAFQQKCADAFHEMKAAGKTIILVTHEMTQRRGVLPPGDADRRRQDPAHRRPRRGRPPLPAAELRTRQPRGPRARVAAQRRRRGEAARHLARGRGRRAGRPTSSTAASFQLRADARGPARLPGIGGRASASPTPTGSTSPTSASPPKTRRRAAAAGRGRAGRRSAPRSRTCSPPGRYFVHLGVNRGLTPRGVALYVNSASTSSSSAATPDRTASSRCRTRSRPTSSVEREGSPR